MTVTELLKEAGVQVRLHGEHEHAGPNFVQMDCVYCSPGWKHFRLGISLDARVCNCWTCGRKPVYKVLTDLIGPAKAAEFLKNRPPPPGVVDKKTGTLKLPEPSYENMPGVFQNYLARRGLRDLDYLRKFWDLRAITVHPTHGWRLLIPIHYRGEVVSWTTRSITDRVDRRYRSAAPDEESISHKKLLYGEDYARHAVVVVEGPMDAMRVGPGATATFGTAVTVSQVLRIAKYPVKVVIFDQEEEAQRQARKLCEVLTCHPGETYNVRLKTGKDPGDCAESEIKDIRKRFLE
jgi:hypothetical protein